MCEHRRVSDHTSTGSQTHGASSLKRGAFVGELCLRALSSGELAAHESRVQLYELTQSFAFTSAELGDIIAVPAGFVSDFGSVPWWALSVVDDDDPHLLFASIIHDWLYVQRGVLRYLDGTVRRRLTRAEADAVLAEAMRVSGAPAWKVAVVHRAVRVGGSKHWRDDAR